MQLVKRSFEEVFDLTAELYFYLFRKRSFEEVFDLTAELYFYLCQKRTIEDIFDFTSKLIKLTDGIAHQVAATLFFEVRSSHISHSYVDASLPYIYVSIHAYDMVSCK